LADGVNVGRVTVTEVEPSLGKEVKTNSSAATCFSSGTTDERPNGFVPFTGMQKAISANIEKSLSVPMLRCSREMKMDRFDALYQRLKPQGVCVSALMAKAVAMAVQEHPIFNSVCDEADGTCFKSEINVAMAAAIDGGLIPPTIKNANEKQILENSEVWRDLVDKARAGGLTPDEYQSGTITITNLGIFGVTKFDPILPPSQGCILAIGVTKENFVDTADSMFGSTVKTATVTAACDHRHIYGADVALFLRTLADIIENRTGQLGWWSSFYREKGRAWGM
jgi:pyruvate dehydrogenase E2 component (dihydrolipoamide acetyltransferase)